MISIPLPRSIIPVLVLAGALLGPLALDAQAQPARGAAVIHHDLTVTVDPAAHHIRVRDRLRIPGALVHAGFTLSLNADLKLSALPGGLVLTAVKTRVAGPDVGIDREDQNPEARVPVNVYTVQGAMPGREIHGEVAYEGVINQPVKQQGDEYARGFSQSPGLIEERGVYLAGSTYWVPQLKDELLTYTLQTELPAGWKSVSQGERSAPAVTAGGPGARETWSVTTPTEEIYLIAAQFTEYAREAGAVTTMAFLRKPDQALADRYLETTAQYLEMYRGLLGPYPYSKFALVENFWETGYGMPSFTLLGEQIIRFPFILHSSYPHELLHNWWGNGVFVDFSTGNWCEGLTAYLADHLIAEQRGLGAEHRRDILQRVTDYVAPETDFPLTRFQSRSNAVTEAIGYGKTAMVWNMLRESVGDEQFVTALQKFYRDHRFAVAGFADIRQSFEAVTGRDLKPFFDQWVTVTGTPELKLEAATARGPTLDLTLAQVQPGRRFALEVPVVIQTATGVVTRIVSLSADPARVSLRLELPAPALRVEVDPQFQLYRRLSPFETPPSLSKAFGAKKVLIVTPAGKAALYAGLLKAWVKDNVATIEDGQLSVLPADQAVWVLGAENKFAPVVAGALPAAVAALEQGVLRVGDSRYAPEGRSLVVGIRHPQNPTSVVVYVTAASEAAATALARKLPHYGKYSWLVFAGDEAVNEAKGEWPAQDSPLVRDLAPAARPIKVTPRKALAEIKPVFDPQRLKADIDWLAGPAREGRGVGTRGLDAAASYLAERLVLLGLSPLVPGASAADRFFQPFTITGENGQPVPVKNVIGVVPGTNPAFAGQALLVSAHYDHLGFGWPDARAGAKGQLHPGADDNASGVAVLLELARLTAKAKPERTVIFAAFTGEEAGLMGSRHYVRTAQGLGVAFPLSGHIADLNLDTVGRLQDGKVTIFGAGSAREWPFIFLGATAVTGVPTNPVTQDVDASDHTAFVEAGVPAVQLFASVATDYHRPTDTPDKIDYAGVVKVAAILKEAVDYLAVRPEPLHFAGRPAANPSAIPVPAAAPSTPPARRAATGIVPDMAFEGEGVRVGSVQPGSGAEKAGLQAGDRLLALGGTKTPNLRAMSEALKQVHPGETVAIEYARESATLTGKLVLGER